MPVLYNQDCIIERIAHFLSNCTESQRRKLQKTMRLIPSKVAALKKGLSCQSQNVAPRQRWQKSAKYYCEAKDVRVRSSYHNLSPLHCLENHLVFRTIQSYVA